MDTMTISLSDEMKAFVEEQAAKAGLAAPAEYVQALLRDAKERVRDRQVVRAKLIEAVESGPPQAMTGRDWDEIRAELDRRSTARAKLDAPLA